MKFFFPHMPRTGGNTVWRVLGDLTGKPVGRCNEFSADGLLWFRGDLSGYGAVGGHIPAAYGDELGPEWKRVTWLRDPVERTLSAYAMVRAGKGACVPPTSLIDFVTSPTISMWWHAHPYQAYLGLGSVERAVEWVEQADFVGITEEMPWARVNSLAENGVKPEWPDCHERCALRMCLDGEYAIYNAARARHLAPNEAGRYLARITKCA